MEGIRTFPCGVSRSLGFNERTVARSEQADLSVALRSRAEDRRLHRLHETTGAALHLIKRSTENEMRRLLQSVFHILQAIDEADVQEAVRETEEAIR